MRTDLVVIGGSSGGLEVMLVLLKRLPPTYLLPTLLVLHQRANRVSGLSQMLAAHTHLRVLEPDDKQRIEAGTLYVAPPNYHLLVEKEKILSLSSDIPINYCRPAIDATLETAADAYGPRLAACILSGANQDGARGAAYVKAKGGQVYVQDPNEAMVAVMPEATMRKAQVDGVLTGKRLADQLATLTRLEAVG